MVDNVVITPGSGNTIGADEVADATLGTVKIQFTKLMDGTLDGTNKAAVNALGSLTAAPKQAATGTVSLVAATTGDVILLAANTSRLGFSIFQTGTSNLNALIATGVSSTTNFSVVMFPNAYFEANYNYIGVVKGNWTVACTGTAYVTEFT